jgi:hypothetical protein
LPQRIERKVKVMWTRKQLKEKGKASFKKAYWKCVLAALILAFIAGGSGGFSGMGTSLGQTFGNVSESNDDEKGSDTTVVVDGDDDESYDESVSVTFNSDLDTDGDGIIENEDGSFTVKSDGISDEDAVAIGVAFVVVVIVVTGVVIALAFVFDAFIVNPLELGCDRFFFKNLDVETQDNMHRQDKISSHRSKAPARLEIEIETANIPLVFNTHVIVTETQSESRRITVLSNLYAVPQEFKTVRRHVRATVSNLPFLAFDRKSKVQSLQDLHILSSYRIVRPLRRRIVISLTIHTTLIALLRAIVVALIVAVVLVTLLRAVVVALVITVILVTLLRTVVVALVIAVVLVTLLRTVIIALIIAVILIPLLRAIIVALTVTVVLITLLRTVIVTLAISVIYISRIIVLRIRNSRCNQCRKQELCTSHFKSVLHFNSPAKLRNTFYR